MYKQVSISPRVITTLSLPYKDSDDNHIHLWSHSKYGVVGVVVAPDGGVKSVTKVVNGLNPTESAATLARRLERSYGTEWVLVYQKSKDMITVLPRLRAAGRDDIEFGGKSYSATTHHIVDHDVKTTQFSRDVGRIFQKPEPSFYPSTLGEMNVDKQQILLEFCQQTIPVEHQKNGYDVYYTQLDTSTLTPEAYVAKQTPDGVSYQEIIPFETLQSMNGMGQRVVVDPEEGRFVTAFPDRAHHSDEYAEATRYDLPGKPMTFGYDKRTGTYLTVYRCGYGSRAYWLFKPPMPIVQHINDFAMPAHFFNDQADFDARNLFYWSNIAKAA